MEKNPRKHFSRIMNKQVNIQISQGSAISGELTCDVCGDVAENPSLLEIFSGYFLDIN